MRPWGLPRLQGDRAYCGNGLPGLRVRGLAPGLLLGAAPHCNPRGILEHTGNGAIPGSEPALAPCCTQDRAAEA